VPYALSAGSLCPDLAAFLPIVVVLMVIEADDAIALVQLLLAILLLFSLLWRLLPLLLLLVRMRHPHPCCWAKEAIGS
jgi:hypothetical protein